ncbi:hypothetical protein BLNAU_7093 [Blattamonas nauphoetae]|uniref:Uncharacterized protein n=1 Tax=Blattamonas nauphoetae TaxID=2049346 RepID=A0ABQ9Y2E9_9EUKA|nr:hypothetical protein BLNAU_7093 [Blattamonas nauphoetae]
MKILDTLVRFCSPGVLLALVKADMIPQLIITLNPQSLSFTESIDIHTVLVSSITGSLWLATPDGLNQLELEDGYEEQAVHETVLKQVLAPSENNPGYFWNSSPTSSDFVHIINQHWLLFFICLYF